MAYSCRHVPGQHAHQHVPAYKDHILTITQRTCPDPYVILDKGTFYMTFTAGDRVEIWAAEELFGFEARARKAAIWRPPPDTEYSGDLWAPELHALHGKWYVYFAADDPKHGNKSHRMFVLVGPSTDQDPMDSSKWEFGGRLEGMPQEQWAIDGTVISLHGSLFFVYSGWPLGKNTGESKQEIYIIEMVSPTQCQGHPVRISTPDNPWEYSGKSGINEGPQFLSSPDGRWTGIVYSCAGSWTHSYKMSTLRFTGGHPLSPSSWRKSTSPLLQAARDDTPPYGPGHGNFVTLPDGPGGSETFAVFHATDAKTGWDGRKARIMRVGWGSDGPFLGSGFCGRCCPDVRHFFEECDGGECGGRGHVGLQEGGGHKTVVRLTVNKGKKKILSILSK